MSFLIWLYFLNLGIYEVFFRGVVCVFFCFVMSVNYTLQNILGFLFLVFVIGSFWRRIQVMKDRL